jgi:hypothetical protein
VQVGTFSRPRITTWSSESELETRLISSFLPVIPLSE